MVAEIDSPQWRKGTLMVELYDEGRSPLIVRHGDWALRKVRRE